MDWLPPSKDLTWIPDPKRSPNVALVIGSIEEDGVKKDIIARYTVQAQFVVIKFFSRRQGVERHTPETWKKLEYEDIIAKHIPSVSTALDSPFQYITENSEADRKRMTALVRWYYVEHEVEVPEDRGKQIHWHKLLTTAVADVSKGIAETRRYNPSIARIERPNAEPSDVTPSAEKSDTSNAGTNSGDQNGANQDNDPEGNDEATGASGPFAELQEQASPSDEECEDTEVKDFFCDRLKEHNLDPVLDHLPNPNEMKFERQEYKTKYLEQRLLIGDTRREGEYVWVYAREDSFEVYFRVHGTANSSTGPRFKLHTRELGGPNYPLRAPFHLICTNERPQREHLSREEEIRLKALVSWYYIASGYFKDVAVDDKEKTLWRENYTKLLLETLRFVGERLESGVPPLVEQHELHESSVRLRPGATPTNNGHAVQSRLDDDESSMAQSSTPLALPSTPQTPVSSELLVSGVTSTQSTGISTSNSRQVRRSPAVVVSGPASSRRHPSQTPNTRNYNGSETTINGHEGRSSSHMAESEPAQSRHTLSHEPIINPETMNGTSLNGHQSPIRAYPSTAATYRSPYAQPATTTQSTQLQILSQRQVQQDSIADSQPSIYQRMSSSRPPSRSLDGSRPSTFGAPSLCEPFAREPSLVTPSRSLPGSSASSPMDLTSSSSTQRGLKRKANFESRRRFDAQILESINKRSRLMDEAGGVQEGVDNLELQKDAQEQEFEVKKQKIDEECDEPLKRLLRAIVESKKQATELLQMPEEDTEKLDELMLVVKESRKQIKELEESRIKRKEEVETEKKEWVDGWEMKHHDLQRRQEEIDEELRESDEKLRQIKLSLEM